MREGTWADRVPFSVRKEKMEIFDSHTHINATEFKNDIPDVIERAQALDVTEMLVISYDTPSTERMLDLI